MKIDVHTHEEGDEFVVTMRCKSPEVQNFTEEDSEFLNAINEAVAKSPDLFNTNYSGKEDALSFIKTVLFGMKEKVYRRVANQMRTGIQIYIEENLRSISQLVYEWSLSKQPDRVLRLMQEFEPEQYKYYVRSADTDEDYD